MARQKNDGRGRLGGRKAGTPNKVTKEHREAISAFIEKRWKDFEEAFDAIDDPEKRCSLMLGLLPFVAPKLSSVDYKERGKQQTLQDELDEISGEKTRK